MLTNLSQALNAPPTPKTAKQILVTFHFSTNVTRFVPKSAAFKTCLAYELSTRAESEMYDLQTRSVRISDSHTLHLADSSVKISSAKDLGHFYTPVKTRRDHY